MTGMLAISVDARPPDMVMNLVGECDITTAPRLAAALAGIPAGYRQLVIDLADLNFIDASGVHVLLKARIVLAAHGIQLNATGARPIVSRVLELTGASRVISVIS